MPVTDTLAYQWYDTPNIHFCTIRDFLDLCRVLSVRVDKAIALDRDGRVLPLPRAAGITNLFADQALFVLSRDD
jgi:methionine biosynthesis protein MetW